MTRQLRRNKSYIHTTDTHSDLTYWCHQHLERRKLEMSSRMIESHVTLTCTWATSILLPPIKWNYKSVMCRGKKRDVLLVIALHRLCYSTMTCQRENGESINWEQFLSQMGFSPRRQHSVHDIDSMYKERKNV